MIRSVVTLLCLCFASAILPAESIVGSWLPEVPPANGMGRAIDFSHDGRVRVSQGITVGEQWQLQQRQRNRFVLQIIDPATGERRAAIELRITKDDPPQLHQTELASGDSVTMVFVSRGNQPDNPPFLGRWGFTNGELGVRAFYEYTDDGWRWLRAPLQIEVGTYTVQGERIVTQWPSGYAYYSHLTIDGPVLNAVAPDGTVERYVRPKMAMSQSAPAPALPPGVVLTMPTPADSRGLRLGRYLLYELEGVGNVTHMRQADLHPAAGLELGIAGDAGAVLLDSSGHILHQVELTRPLGRVEIVEVEGDGRCEFMNRGGRGGPVQLFDHDGATLWSYLPKLGANDMAAGDLDNDGRLDFVVGGNGGTGVHRLDHAGRALWQESDHNVWHLEIVQLADGSNAILSTTAAGDLTWRDADGSLLQRSNFPWQPATFALFSGDPTTDHPIRLTAFSRSQRTLAILDPAGNTELEIPLAVAPALEIIDVWARPVRFRDTLPTAIAVVLQLRRQFESDAGELMVFDNTGELLFRETVDQSFTAIAVLPGTSSSGQRLLVGGNGRVWEYRWLGD